MAIDGLGDWRVECTSAMDHHNSRAIITYRYFFWSLRAWFPEMPAHSTRKPSSSQRWTWVFALPPGWPASPSDCYPAANWTWLSPPAPNPSSINSFPELLWRQSLEDFSNCDQCHSFCPNWVPSAVILTQDYGNGIHPSTLLHPSNLTWCWPQSKTSRKYRF